MDIHRCRFVPYSPQAINSLAFSHPPSTELQGRGEPTLRLAIGRANGDIEVWNPLKGVWFQETILRGGKDRSIEGLAWTLDPSEKSPDNKELPGKLRLFSIGYSSVVTEWDLEHGRPARHSSGNYGEIWCLAAQPRWKASKSKDGKPLPPAEGEFVGQHLAVGCADGAIVILSTAEGDLKYVRAMRPSTKRSRVLNITFQNRNTIVAGYADSSIRIFDIRNGNILRTATLGKGPNKAAKELLVWCVKCLPDGTIVSGDSAGEIRFWDAKNYSLIQRIQSHRADVLDIAVSADGGTVVTAGADQRTAVYKLKAPEKGAKTGRWVEVMHRRYHTHDVKALAVYETKDISVVVSGGLDTTPVVVPLRTHGKELHRKLPNLPQFPQLSSSPSSRLLMSWWDREVNIWRVSSSPTSQSGPPEPQQHRLVAKVLFQGDENLTSAVLSPNGRILVASSISEVKVFALSAKDEGISSSLQVNKVKISSEISNFGAKEISISPDCKWLCLVRPDNIVCIAKIDKDDEFPDRCRINPQIQKLRRISRSFPRGKLHHGTLGEYERTIRCVTFSGDSKILACGDLSGSIDVWILDTERRAKEQTVKDTFCSESEDYSSSEEGDQPNDYGQYWVRSQLDSPIPRLKSAILLMAFRPQSLLAHQRLTNGTLTKNPAPHHSSSIEDRLLVLTSEHHISEFNVLQGKLTQWSRRNPKSYLPSRFSIIQDRAQGILWDTNGEKERLWLYGSSWLWMFDLAQDFPTPPGLENEEKGAIASTTDPTKEEPPSPTKKRKRNGEGKKLEPNVGAGSRMPLWENNIGLGRKIRKVSGNDGSTAQWVSLDKRQTEYQDQQDDQYENDPSNATLARFRREGSVSAGQDHHDNASESASDEGEHTHGPSAVGANSGTSHSSQVAVAVVIQSQGSSAAGNTARTDSDSCVAGQQVLDIPSQPQAQCRQKGRRWWYTFKYRDILGIALLDQGTSGNHGGGLEVAVVERPIWDVALPDRYIRDYE
ncbi:U3 small nucleolar RNA-associated protein [Ophidiomyces ophidiicola]|nr:U3 small nucleolar RNA-associated protein [Ophidiomyces ophidiicola]KAI1981780.1 U3 small nucleolar RNA-associated protein [Ophidiomyces ophidiicola]KAI1984891.1 U3 small nucleolar RNA-associated protein [Ophidiomyces ophidiicola]KAI2003366.1 U3 small nucleolar RNA-associated protein [Ophidiomyces ophidiicola]